MSHVNSWETLSHCRTLSYLIPRHPALTFPERCAARLAIIILYPKILLYIEGSPRAHLHVAETLRFTSDINQPSLPTPFCSLLVSMSVFIALSTVFHSINSPNNSPFSDSVLPVVSLPYRSFQLYNYSIKVSFSPDIIHSG